MRVKIRDWFKRAWSWIHTVITEFQKEHGSLTAAALALFGLLSLFPLMLLAIAGGSFALGDPTQALDRINSVLGQVLVGNARDAVVSVLAGVLKTRSLAGIASLLGFLWAASRVFNIMTEAFNMAWDVRQARGFVKRNLLAIGLVLLTLIFGVIIFVAPLGVGLVLHYSDSFTHWLGVPVKPSAAWPVLANLISYLATIGLFAIFYKYIPNRHVHWRAALVGAIVAGTIWILFRYLFELYLVNFAQYNKIYGTLAGFIVLILWLNYSAMILLLGAITSAVFSARVFGDRAEHPRRRGYDERDAA